MQITASAERHVDAQPSVVYGLVRDFVQHHPRFLPPQFGDLEVETGGVGAGTVLSYTFTLGGRTTAYRVRIGEPEPGRMLIESDPSKRMLTVWTVDHAPGGGSDVRIETRWYTDGPRGLVEKLLAPRLLRAVYRDELRRLDRYARDADRFARRAAISAERTIVAVR